MPTLLHGQSCTHAADRGLTSRAVLVPQPSDCSPRLALLWAFASLLTARVSTENILDSVSAALVPTSTYPSGSPWRRLPHGPALWKAGPSHPGHSEPAVAGVLSPHTHTCPPSLQEAPEMINPADKVLHLPRRGSEAGVLGPALDDPAGGAQTSSFLLSAGLLLPQEPPRSLPGL